MDLINACKSNDTEKALDLIMNININLGIVDFDERTLKTHHIDRNNNTAFILACYGGMTEVALELIKTGHAKPEQVNNFGSTALIWACRNEMTEVISELIKMGHVKPDYIDKYDNMALIVACQKRETEVALELIKTGKFNP